MSSALVGVTGTDGTSIFQGKVVTGFSNAEEELVYKLEVSGTVCQGTFIATKNRPSRSCSKIASKNSARHMRKQMSLGRCVTIPLRS